MWRRVLFVILPTLAVAGLVLIILSCAWFERYLPLLTIPFILLAPVPTILIGSMSGGPLSVGPSQSAREAAMFMTSAMGASALIVPFFLHHLEKIPLNSALMACGGTVLLFATVIEYQIYFNAEEESTF